MMKNIIFKGFCFKEMQKKIDREVVEGKNGSRKFLCFPCSFVKMGELIKVCMIIKKGSNR